MPKAKAKKPPKKIPGLTAKQKARYDLFVEHYMTNNRNATQAAIAAGYSKSSARSTGAAILHHEYTQEKLKNITEKVMERIGITREEVIARVTALSRADFRTIASWGFEPVTEKDEDGNEVPVFGRNGKPLYEFTLSPIDSDKLTHEAAMTIESIQVKHSKFGMDIKIKQRDPTPALKMLCEHFGITNAGKGEEDDDESDKRPVGRITKIAINTVDARKPKP